MLTSGKRAQKVKKYIPKAFKEELKQGLKTCRALTGGARVYPDFMVVGVMKGGTTSLYNYLVQHPNLRPAFEKEVQYYGDNEHRGIGWYRGHFMTRAERSLHDVLQRRVLTGEATPHYIYNPSAPLKIKAENPNLRVVMMLREPVRRAYSHHHWGIKMGTFTEEGNPFPRRIERELEWLTSNTDVYSRPDAYRLIRKHATLLGPGMYSEYLGAWFDAFPQPNLLLIDSASFFANPRLETARTFEFLGLPPADGIDFRNYNKNDYSELDSRLASKMNRFFASYNQVLFETYGIDYRRP